LIFKFLLVLIKKQLILNFYEIIGLEEKGIKMKSRKHEWCIINFKKDAFKFFNLNNYVNYTIMIF
jgi:hypothetical protein